MEPWFSKNDINMFYKYLDNSKAYFEFGSGGSTYQASIRKNIEIIYSVESDKEWHDKMKQLISNNNIIFIYNEMDTRPKSLGYPGIKSTPAQWKEYSDKFIVLDKDKREKIDLILIDGRFRVACCLKCFDTINLNCLIVFDDFLNRPQYHIILNYYDIIEKTQDNKMVVLKKKEGINSIDPNIICKYELISD